MELKDNITSYFKPLHTMLLNPLHGVERGAYLSEGLYE
jgi:hypothetical protein